MTGGSGQGFFAYDPSGNTAMRVSGTGSVLDSYVIDSYGSVVAGNASNTDPPYAFGGEFGYYTDTETGLTLCDHRYYDSAKGRWLNRDPIGFGGGGFFVSSLRTIPEIRPIYSSISIRSRSLWTE